MTSMEWLFLRERLKLKSSTDIFQLAFLVSRSKLSVFMTACSCL